MNKQTILNYLNSIAGIKTISGQYIDIQTGAPGYQSIVNIDNSTGYWLGFIEGNLWYYGDTGAPTNAIIQTLINYWNAGGLVGLCMFMPNPTTGGAMEDTSSINGADLIVSGNTTNTNFVNSLSQVAAILMQLQSAGVTVILRPFHEANGNYFWWGTQGSSLLTSTQFIDMWIYMYNYFETYGLTNILYMFAQNLNTGSLTANYPGSQYVDLVGIDVYTNTPGLSAQSNYNTLLQYGKPIAFSEFGPGSPTAGNTSFDETVLINEISQYTPNIVYWNQWWDGNAGSAGWGMAECLNVQTALSNSRVLNRGQFNINLPLTYQSKYLTVENGIITDKFSTSVSNGSLSAGNIVSLNKNGLIDQSMLINNSDNYISSIPPAIITAGTQGIGNAFWLENGSTSSFALPSGNNTAFVAFKWNGNFPIARVSISVDTAGIPISPATTCAIRVGIYGYSDVTNQPLTLLFEPTAITPFDGSTIGIKSLIAPTNFALYSLPPGIYFIGFMSADATVTTPLLSQYNFAYTADLTGAIGISYESGAYSSFLSNTDNATNKATSLIASVTTGNINYSSFVSGNNGGAYKIWFGAS